MMIKIMVNGIANLFSVFRWLAATNPSVTPNRLTTTSPSPSRTATMRKFAAERVRAFLPSSREGLETFSSLSLSLAPFFSALLPLDLIDQTLHLPTHPPPPLPSPPHHLHSVLRVLYFWNLLLQIAGDFSFVWRLVFFPPSLFFSTVYFA